MEGGANLNLNIMDDKEKDAIAHVDAMMEKNKEKWATDPILSKIKWMEREDLLRVINGSYIAERFFNRSRSWFSVKLNNGLSNGKPTGFTKEELKTLSNALYTIAFELEDLADELASEAK